MGALAFTPAVHLFGTGTAVQRAAAGGNPGRVARLASARHRQRWWRPRGGRLRRLNPGARVEARIRKVLLVLEQIGSRAGVGTAERGRERSWRPRR